MTIKAENPVEFTVKNRPGGFSDHLQCVGGLFCATLGAGIYFDSIAASIMIGGILAYVDIRIDDIIQALCRR